MPRLSIWNSGKKGADYKFIDRSISEFFGASGTAVYVHMYLGTYDQTPTSNTGTTPGGGGGGGGGSTPPIPGPDPITGVVGPGGSGGSAGGFPNDADKQEVVQNGDDTGGTGNRGQTIATGSEDFDFTLVLTSGHPIVPDPHYGSNSSSNSSNSGGGSSGNSSSNSANTGGGSGGSGSGGSGSNSSNSGGGTVSSPTYTPNSIQDVLFLENRDRKYADEVVELRGIYNVTDVDFDLRQFGLFLQNDTLFIEFHLNDMFHMLGRKLMSGDVIELPHQRDDMLLDPNAPAINKFYVVEDANRASDGYSPTWWPHIWRVKVVPMTGSQEYQDILDKNVKDPFGFDTGDKLGDIMTTIGTELGINEDIVEQAKKSVLNRNFETRQFFVFPGDETTRQNPWIYAGDGHPPNGAIPVGSGTKFPLTANEGDYFLRLDYSPAALFLRTGNKWKLQELNYRNEWSAAHRVLEAFINNNKTASFKDGTTAPEKQPLYQAVKPRADFP